MKQVGNDNTEKTAQCFVNWCISTVFWPSGSVLWRVQVFELGFGTGLVSGGLVAATLVAGYRAITISTQTVHKLALAKLARAPQVRAALGSGISSGNLRAYVMYPGHLSIGSKRLGWVEPRAQMLFQVTGERGEGIATLEAVKHRGRVVISLLAVDTLAAPGRPSQLVLVQGSEEKLHVRGTLRGFLQSERAQYIPQDRVATDDDFLKEQESLPAVEEGEEGAAAAGGDSAAKQQ